MNKMRVFARKMAEDKAQLRTTVIFQQIEELLQQAGVWNQSLHLVIRTDEKGNLFKSIRTKVDTYTLFHSLRNHTERQLAKDYTKQIIEGNLLRQPSLSASVPSRMRVWSYDDEGNRTYKNKRWEPRAK